jgi:hypothetical protein
MDAVEELADCDDADRPVFVAGERIDRLSAALTVDEDTGVDQDGQGLSGGPSSIRARRTSSSKSRSTGGAVATIARKCSLDTSRVFGGPITATVAPLRVTSISSPRETRFRILEKFRATSVAVKRATIELYQINQTQPRG